MRTWSNGATYISKAVSLTVDNFRKVSSGTRSNQFLNSIIIVERDRHDLFERRSWIVMGFGRSGPEADRWLDRYFELIGQAHLPLALPG